MQVRFFLGIYLITAVFVAGFELGHRQQAVALEGCEFIAYQVGRAVVEAESKAAACDEIFNNLGHFEEGMEPTP